MEKRMSDFYIEYAKVFAKRNNTNLEQLCKERAADFLLENPNAQKEAVCLAVAFQLAGELICAEKQEVLN
jgi:hypothetical protein